MGFRAAFTSVIRAVSRPSMAVPAALVAVLALLSPPSMEDASAQGFRTQGSRGSFSGGGPAASRCRGGPCRSRACVDRHVRISASRPQRRPWHPAKAAWAWAVRAWAAWLARQAAIRAPNGRPPSSEGWRPPSAAPALAADHCAAGRRHRRRRARRAVGSAVQRQRRRSAAANRPRRPAIRPAARQLGAAMCPTRWWSRSPPTSRRRPIAALARRHRLTQLETVNLQSQRHDDPALADHRPPPRCRRWCVRSRPRHRDFGAAELSSRRCRKPAHAHGLGDLEQYALAKLRMPQAHALATGDHVLIAVINSGVDTQHPELAGMIVDTFDAIGSGDQVHPHGTAIAGAIVARAPS